MLIALQLDLFLKIRLHLTVHLTKVNHFIVREECKIIIMRKKQKMKIFLGVPQCRIRCNQIKTY